MRHAAVCASALAMVLAVPAAAQEASELPVDENVFRGDYVVVGAGAFSGPTYKGSDTSRIRPALGAVGEVGGIGFAIRGPSLSLDLISDPPGADVGFRLGPQIGLRSNRSGNSGDEIVAKLGKLDKAVEAGFRAGVSFDDVLSRKDRLSAGVSVRWDVSGKGSGRVITPSAAYRLPVSRGQAFGAQVALRFGNGDFADYNYGITAEGAAASGLPAYQAKGGLQEASLGIATARDLDGNFLNGGFAIGAGALYSRLYGSAAATPITSIRGSRTQWSFGAGVSYTF